MDRAALLGRNVAMVMAASCTTQLLGVQGSMDPLLRLLRNDVCMFLVNRDISHLQMQIHS